MEPDADRDFCCLREVAVIWSLSHPGESTSVDTLQELTWQPWCSWPAGPSTGSHPTSKVSYYLSKQNVR